MATSVAMTRERHSVDQQEFATNTARRNTGMHVTSRIIVKLMRSSLMRSAFPEQSSSRKQNDSHRRRHGPPFSNLFCLLSNIVGRCAQRSLPIWASFFYFLSRSEESSRPHSDEKHSKAFLRVVMRWLMPCVGPQRAPLSQ